MKILQTANLGRALGGVSGSIRYTLYNTLGTEISASQNTGIYELGSSTGLYGVELDLAPAFSGSVVWSSTTSANVFATEEIKSDQRMARLIHTGKWKIDANTKQMIFYQENNSSVIARYNLFDRNGNPSIDEVFERVYSGSV
jgi:hypothetical protein